MPIYYLILDHKAIFRPQVSAPLGPVVAIVGLDDDGLSDRRCRREQGETNKEDGHDALAQRSLDAHLPGHDQGGDWNWLDRMGGAQNAWSSEKNFDRDAVLLEKKRRCVLANDVRIGGNGLSADLVMKRLTAKGLGLDVNGSEGIKENYRGKLNGHDFYGSFCAYQDDIFACVIQRCR
jgi:hypothetical protein